MEDHAGNIADTISEQGDEKNMLVQNMERLSYVIEQLELEHLCECKQETLSLLIIELQEISKVIRSIPQEVIQGYITSKKVFLKDLQEASIELLLALDHYNAKGRTSQFYRYLTMCQEHLEQAIERKWESSKVKEIIRKESIPKPPPSDILTQARTHYEKIIRAQIAFVQAYELLLDNDNLQINRYNHLITILNTMKHPIQELYQLLSGQTVIPNNSVIPLYQLQVHLGYINEQIQRLLELIYTFRVSYRTSVKQANKISQEIIHKLELLQRRSSELPRAIIALLDQTHFYANSNRRLHLVEPTRKYI